MRHDRLDSLGCREVGTGVRSGWRTGTTWLVALVAGLLLAACTPGGSSHGSGSGPSGAARPPAGTPRLTGSRACPDAAGFTCSTLRVPLDHSGRVAGTLDLQVAAADGARTPRGVLVLLTGGPGQPGVPFVSRLSRTLDTAFAGYRLVMFDQRGTGGEAIQCPALQQAMGSSDLRPPPAAAVRDCGASVGDKRRFYSTADTVADLEALRVALGAPKLTLDGVSYGTFVAERYALAHPDRVDKLVLDSVVPHDDPIFLPVDNMRATVRVLRSVCQQRACPSDPVDDLAAVVHSRGGGPELLDTLVTLSVAAPDFRGVPEALHAARQGQPGELDRLVAAVRQGSAATAPELSQGLHASTLCADTPAPWGDSSAPLQGRGAALRTAVDQLPEPELFPFDRATAMGNGIAQTCLAWPPTPAPPSPPPGAKLPPVPVLLLAGERDLSTPLPWAQAEAKLAPRGRLVVVPDAGHSVQSRATGDAGRRAVAEFLRG
jgi:pimeloyl-ACP methyl ester carboxylesterase